MGLTKDDLRAIKNIVEDATEDVKIQTAAGFAEVHNKIDDLATEIKTVKADIEVLKSDVEDTKNTVGRIENVQKAKIVRADRHDQDIAVLKKQLAA